MDNKEINRFTPISNLDLVYQGLMNELYPHEKVPIDFELSFIRKKSKYPIINNMRFSSLNILYEANTNLGYILHKYCLN